MIWVKIVSHASFNFFEVFSSLHFFTSSTRLISFIWSTCRFALYSLTVGGLNFIIRLISVNLISDNNFGIHHTIFLPVRIIRWEK
ncbi:hypothetical protein CW304_20130 [Bacillus sp. UFRGS-B20]|nr:hypothetical protein CW304_20130 [Bacillus sp. UFRGS-B20]